MLWKRRSVLSVTIIVCGLGLLWCLYQNVMIQEGMTTTDQFLATDQMFVAIDNDVPGTSHSNILQRAHTNSESRHLLSRSDLERYTTYLQLKIENTQDLHYPYKSKIEIQTGPYVVGEIFNVRVTLHDSLGRPLKSGGDYVRIWLREKSKNSSVNGYTVDHGNGTYTGVLVLPWKGQPEIIVSVANTKEHISLFTNSTETNGILFAINSKFVDSTRKHTGITSCSPILTGLNKCYKNIACNLTTFNYGLPLFCCQPKSPYLECTDIKMINCNDDTNHITPDMYNVASYRHKRFKPIRINVVEGAVTRLRSPPITCHDRPRTDTWEDNTPAGYYHKNHWINLHCTPRIQPDSYKLCFRDKRFVFLGDSNSRGIFAQLVDMAMSEIATTNYTKGDHWHELLQARNQALNLDLMWAPHNVPLFVNAFQNIDTMRSIGSWLDEIPDDKPIVVIIHLYYHLTKATLSIFRAMVKDARAAVDRLWKRAPDTAVFIQGPHSITYKTILEPLDFLRRCHEQIWYEAFRGIHDRVVYLDWWDMTAGNENINVHPSVEVQQDVTRMIMSYLCSSH